MPAVHKYRDTEFKPGRLNTTALGMKELEKEFT